MSDIGNRIRELRQQKNIGQNQLAKMAGISQAGLSAIENSTKSPSVSTIERIADALQTTVSELMGENTETRTLNNDDIKFAVFGDPDVTDAQFEEIKKIARIIRERDKK